MREVEDDIHRHCFGVETEQGTIDDRKVLFVKNVISGTLASIAEKHNVRAFWYNGRYFIREKECDDDR